MRSPGLRKRLDPLERIGRLRSLITQALRQSLRPEQVALTLALGNTIGISPVYGTTMTTSTLVALALRLNLPLMQAALWIVWPLQLLLILPFIRLGERLWRHPALPLDRAEILAIFKQGPSAVAAQLGWALAHAFSAWLLLAICLIPALYAIYLPLLRRAERRHLAAKHRLVQGPDQVRPPGSPASLSDQGATSGPSTEPPPSGAAPDASPAMKRNAP